MRRLGRVSPSTLAALDCFLVLGLLGIYLKLSMLGPQWTAIARFLGLSAPEDLSLTSRLGFFVDDIWLNLLAIPMVGTVAVAAFGRYRVAAAAMAAATLGMVYFVELQIQREVGQYLSPDAVRDLFGWAMSSAGTALDYVIGSYVRSPQLTACIDILVAAGGTTKYDVPVVLDLLRGRLDRVREHLDGDSTVINRRFPQLDFGTTGGRLLTLKGATLLHVAAEYRNVDATLLLLDRGADVNGRATIDEAGVGGQTAIFHAVTQREDRGIPVARILLDRGADLSIRAKLPGHYERPGEVVECTPLGYALRFKDEPKRADKIETVALLRERRAIE